MTKAGESWARQAINDARTGMQTRGVSNSLMDQAEFWVRAFIAEAWKRAAELADGDEVDLYLGDAFLILTRELIGDERKEATHAD